ncbi:MAG: hypothetical protein JNJ60_22640 [Rhodocyclaceae bacterium]|nr:hypothetical protein [Rhodocyclaceae bacterium]
MKFWFSSKSAAPDLFETNLGVECAWPTAVFSGSLRSAQTTPPQAANDLPAPAQAAPRSRQD